jgi:hypothetical protein
MKNFLLRLQNVFNPSLAALSLAARSRTLMSYVLALASLALLIAQPAQAQIAFRAATSATAAGITPAFRSAASATTTGATLTITKPSAVAANDVLIASIGVTPSTVTIAAPAGWTLIRRVDNAGPTANTLAVYYKVATASEPASYAWGVSGSSFSVGGVQAFTGVDTAAPIDAENGQPTASATTHATPSVSTGMANDGGDVRRLCLRAHLDCACGHDRIFRPTQRQQQCHRDVDRRGPGIASGCGHHGR